MSSCLSEYRLCPSMAILDIRLLHGKKDFGRRQDEQDIQDGIYPVHPGQVESGTDKAAFHGMLKYRTVRYLGCRVCASMEAMKSEAAIRESGISSQETVTGIGVVARGAAAVCRGFGKGVYGNSKFCRTNPFWRTSRSLSNYCKINMLQTKKIVPRAL